MKMRTGTLLVACFAIVTFKNFGTSVEVSSQIDLDSENGTEEALSNAHDSIVGENLNIFDISSDSVSNRRRHPRNWRRGNGFVRSGEPRKRRIFPHDFPRQPKIINNIQIVLNGNDTVPEGNFCKRDVCNVSVSSKADEEGNIVTEIHLSIVASTKPGVKIDEVPVIDGFRGIENDERPIFQPPIFPPTLTHLPREATPQIQTNNQGYGEPLYRRTFQRPQTNYRNYGDRGNAGFRGRNTWERERPVVDDKIEPPLSKTNFGEDD